MSLKALFESTIKAPVKLPRDKSDCCIPVIVYGTDVPLGKLVVVKKNLTASPSNMSSNLDVKV